MKEIIPPEQHDESLNRWRGGRAKVWLYHISHRKLAIRIESPTEPEVLYLVGNSCESIRGPFVWSNANVSITNEPHPQTGENVCRVVDADAEFELRCSSAALARGPVDDMDRSFEDFLGDPPADDIA